MTKMKKIEEKIKFEKNIKFETNVKFQIYLPPPLLRFILWIWCLIFTGPKRNFEKPNISRLYFGIVTVVM